MGGERLIFDDIEPACAEAGLGGGTVRCLLAEAENLGEGIFDFITWGEEPTDFEEFIPLLAVVWGEGVERGVVSDSLFSCSMRAWRAFSRSLRNFGIFLAFCCELSFPVLVNSTSHASMSGCGPSCFPFSSPGPRGAWDTCSRALSVESCSLVWSKPIVKAVDISSLAREALDQGASLEDLQAT